MFPSLALAVLFASSVLVAADPDPTTPGTDAVYKAGTPCPIAWTVDSTGVWKTMTIQLMTGDNLNMVPLTTVSSTVDATNPSAATFSWTCPEVIPNAAIYFYQFTTPASNNTLWTTRFGISSDSGAITAPPNNTQPNGEKIPWGKGALANPAAANPSVAGATPAATTVATSPLTTALSSDLPSSSLLPAATTPETNGTATASSASASSGVGSDASNVNAAMAFSVDGRIFQAMIALSIAATGFTTLL
ncbi:hypothetical protein PILCRDRAFT_811987 [Piloderma croceum F 1598]|uniref:Yeast cell wall synthesis Kre9/Knh1-like N-terminal domain-containing protein n=1 Tax=Piloderma croceum (strain F 1598) TaxID=765440 RepID=A0A0C3G1T5_PILCF|nr:hypothetical protein PILCRDRAFT_811987 [Piloderma croceum F 1598]